MMLLMIKLLSYLLQFASWVKLWRSKTVSSLSKETSTAVHQTSIALVALAKHIITERNYNYVLFGQFQSDAIKKRFGWYRQC